MDEKLKADIESMVASIFESKEKDVQVQKTEEALTKSVSTISDLTQALEGKNVELEEMKASLDSSADQVKTLTSELEAVQTKVKDLETVVASKTQELEVAVKALDDIKKDKAAEIRMSEIKEAGVARVDIEGQLKKVREMSDEEFATYKAELIEVKASVEAALAKKADTEKTDIEKAAAEKAAAEKAATEKAEAEKAAAEKAAANAALNFETASAETITGKYKKLGEALAAGYKVKKD